MEEQLSLGTGWTKKKSKVDGEHETKVMGEWRSLSKKGWNPCRTFGSTSLAPHTWKVLGTARGWNPFQQGWSGTYGWPPTSLSFLRQWDERDQADVWSGWLIHALPVGDGAEGCPSASQLGDVAGGRQGRTTKLWWQEEMGWSLRETDARGQDDRKAAAFQENINRSSKS